MLLSIQSFNSKSVDVSIYLLTIRLILCDTFTNDSQHIACNAHELNLAVESCLNSLLKILKESSLQTITPQTWQIIRNGNHIVIFAKVWHEGTSAFQPNSLRITSKNRPGYRSLVRLVYTVLCVNLYIFH